MFVFFYRLKHRRLTAFDKANFGNKISGSFITIIMGKCISFSFYLLFIIIILFSDFISFSFTVSVEVTQISFLVHNCRIKEMKMKYSVPAYINLDSDNGNCHKILGVVVEHNVLAQQRILYNLPISSNSKYLLKRLQKYLHLIIKNKSGILTRSACEGPGFKSDFIFACMRGHPNEPNEQNSIKRCMETISTSGYSNSRFISC